MVTSTCMISWFYQFLNLEQKQKHHNSYFFKNKYICSTLKFFRIRLYWLFAQPFINREILLFLLRNDGLQFPDYWPLVNFVRDLTSFLTEDTMRYLTSNFIENKMRNLILTSNFSSPHSSPAIVLCSFRIPQMRGAG